MNTKKIVIIVLVVFVIGAGIYFYGDANEPHGDDTDTKGSTGMRIEANAVVANEQRPSSTVRVSLVHLGTSGFVVIHEDKNGAPEAILGTSALLHDGSNEEVTITLSRVTQNGEKLYAMLHFDTDQNGTFNASIDKPVGSRLGGPIMQSFEISSDAPEGSPIYNL